MDLMEGLKFLAISVAAGVVTAIAVQVVTGHLEQKAKMAARSEMEQILIISAQQQQAQPIQKVTRPLPITSTQSTHTLI